MNNLCFEEISKWQRMSADLVCGYHDAATPSNPPSPRIGECGLAVSCESGIGESGIWNDGQRVCGMPDFIR